MVNVSITAQDWKRYSIWITSAFIIGAVGFAHGNIYAHEKAIAVLQSKQTDYDKRQDRMEEILLDILKELRQ